MALLALLAGCTPDQPQAPPPAAPIPGERTKPDVVLLVLDTLRADRLSQYGYDLPTGVGIEAFAAAATRFDQALAPAPWTLPSTATIHTGQHPLHHRLRRTGDVLPASDTTLAERLQAAGWTTAAFSHNAQVSAKVGFDQGFQTFSVPQAHVLDYPNAGKMIREVTRVTAAHPADPLFLYLQPMNCHGPYRVPEKRRQALLGRDPLAGFDYHRGPMARILAGHPEAAKNVTPAYLQSLNEQYDTATRYTLDQVGMLLGNLRAQGRYDDALVILTADHGEQLYDHGGFTHGNGLHREVLRVPLFIKLPRQSTAAVVSEAVSLADILPTVLDVLDIPVKPGDSPFDGISLAPAIDGGALPERAFVADVRWPARAVEQSIQRGPWKLIAITSDYAGRDGQRLLFDVAADPTERVDRAAAEPGVVARLLADLDAQATAFAAGSTEPANNADALNQDQLQALGYLE